MELPQLPNSGLAKRFPCDASTLSFRQLVTNVSMTPPVMVALLDKGLFVCHRDLTTAVELMDQAAVSVVHYLIHHILKYATYLFTFMDTLHKAVSLEKEVYVALMLSRMPPIVFMTSKTVTLFCQSITKLNPGLIQTVSRYSPLWLRIKLFLSALSCKKPEIIPFMFEIIPCRNPRVKCAGPPNLSINIMDKVYLAAQVMKACAVIIGPQALAVKVAVSSQRMTPFSKCVFINFMLKNKGVDVKHLQVRGGFSPLHCATMLTLSSGESLIDNYYSFTYL